MRNSLVLLVFMFACGGTAAPPPVQNVAPAGPVSAPPPAPRRAVDVAMEKMDEFTNRMCDCADKACADAERYGECAAKIKLKAAK